MKKLIIITLITIIASVSIAGEIRTTPQDIVLLDPLTDQVELLSQNYFYGSDPYIVIKYNILTSDGDVVKAQSLTLTGQDFTDFVSGIGATMYSRGDTAIWADIQSKYDTQAK